MYDDSYRNDRSRPTLFVKTLLALALPVVFVPINALLCTVGFAIINGLLELLLVPPLQSHSTWAHFGWVVLMLGGAGGLYGLSFALLPFTRFFLWLPAFGAISWLVYWFVFQSPPDASEVNVTSAIVVAVAVVLLAALASRFTYRLANDNESADE